MSRRQKILLIQVPYTQIMHVFPLGLAYIASFIQKHGYDVEVYDINMTRDSKEKVISKLLSTNFDYIGISALSNRFSYVGWLSKEIKKIKNIPIIVGNGLATGAHKLVLNNLPEVDFCVLGEGEETMLDILTKTSHPETIEGIAYKNDSGEVIVNKHRTSQVNVDELPWPAYDLFDMNKYFVETADFLDTGYFSLRGNKNYVRKMAYMITARGCPYNCKFCGRIIPKVRIRSISDVVKEIKYLQDNYGVSGITFYDELLALNKERTIQLGKALKEMDILWSCQGRVNLVDREFLRQIKEYGCISLGYGIESGSQTILDAMNKKISVEQIIKAMQAAEEVGLEVKIQLIFGYPGETKETAYETIDLFKQLKSPGRRFNIIRPLPGSRLYHELLDQGVIKDELDFIKNLEIALDKNLPIVNLTGFDDDEIKLMSRKVEGLMLLNYLKYMIIHNPADLLNKFMTNKRSFKRIGGFLGRYALSYSKPLYNYYFKDNIFPEGYSLYSKPN